MESEKEIWIEKALNSLDGIHAAAPPASLHRAVMQRIQAEKYSLKTDRITALPVYRAAAAVLLILSINIFTCVSFSKNMSLKKNMESLAREYSITGSSDAFINL